MAADPRDMGASPAPNDLASGLGRLITLFVVDAGVIVVLEDGVRLLARDGGELSRWESRRRLTTAAFDGTYLAVADGASVVSLTPALVELASAFLIEPCASAVIVSGHRFVCGPDNDWDRIFYTYQLPDGEALTRSSPYTYNGIPMKLVPGSDAFITVTTDLSPSDYHLYLVEGDGRAVFVDESPYHGDFAITDVFAFDGSPATHLVTHQGLLLEIGSECTPAASPPRCLVRDGALGLLDDRGRYLAMTNDGAGDLYTLTDPAGELIEPPCQAGCRVQRIDLAARLVRSESTWRSLAADVTAFAHDDVSGRMAVGYHLACEPFEPCRDWRVALLPVE